MAVIDKSQKINSEKVGGEGLSEQISLSDNFAESKYAALDRDQFICDNMGLVHSCAKRFTGRGIEYDDLFQAGCMGLVKAADRFDPERGFMFSTYAVPVILGEMRRLFRDGGAIKVSRSLKELSMRGARERENFINDNGREPTVSEMADLLGISIEDAAEAMSAALPPLSLTRDSDDDNDGDEIDVPIGAPDTTVLNRLVLEQLISALESKDRALIVLRYLQNKTQQETASLLGMTQVQVSRRERALLAEMRKKLGG